MRQKVERVKETEQKTDRQREERKREKNIWRTISFLSLDVDGRRGRKRRVRKIFFLECNLGISFDMIFVLIFLF